MDKESYRKYLEKVFEYLNVWSLCSLYNQEYPEYKINYNNLKNFVNKKMYEKISIKRLEKLTYFIKQQVAVKLILEDSKDKHIIEKSKKEIKQEIIAILKNMKESNNEI